MSDVPEPIRRALLAIARHGAGWLLLLPGLGLLGATVLIPAADDLDDARWRRDRVLAAHEHQTERLERARAYLAALRDPSPELVDALAQEQLNLIPTSARPIGWIDELAVSRPVRGPVLEPPVPATPDRIQNRSRLASWATGERSRLVLIAVGAMCVLLGLIPVGAGRTGSA